MLIDTSPSVRPVFDEEKMTATSFLESILRPNDLALVMGFDRSVTLVQDYTESTRRLKAAINELEIGGGTSLYDAVCSPDVREISQVQKMKKYLNYLGVGVDPAGRFLHQIRRVTTEADFFRVCTDFLDHEQPMGLEPFRGDQDDRRCVAGRVS